MNFKSDTMENVTIVGMTGPKDDSFRQVRVTLSTSPKTVYTIMDCSSLVDQMGLRKIIPPAYVYGHDKYIKLIYTMIDMGRSKRPIDVLVSSTDYFGTDGIIVDVKYSCDASVCADI